MSDDPSGGKMMDEINRLQKEPCLCDDKIECERCEQIGELRISQLYGMREQHGHFGSVPDFMESEGSIADVPDMDPCPRCSGGGLVDKKYCPVCGGSGDIPK